MTSSQVRWKRIGSSPKGGPVGNSFRGEERMLAVRYKDSDLPCAESGEYRPHQHLIEHVPVIPPRFRLWTTLSRWRVGPDRTCASNTTAIPRRIVTARWLALGCPGVQVVVKSPVTPH
jgi:hypothetical protein